jgi:DNA-directed RNA polymerase specialized sigma24 family protein
VEFAGAFPRHRGAGDAPDPRQPRLEAEAHQARRGRVHVPLDETIALPIAEEDRILALDEALERLNELNPRHAKVVECRFFVGMTIEETAAALDVSPVTIKRDWSVLRLWLGRELGEGA